ncbi:GNAT family N-acetyltransferase [Bowmanella sp. Y26]|uniref:GNAT family N-acetyltransferase n=1 Tax=Bowmanella yangjiangensis TaxID=2811230 RepID=UPI001BDD3581|nr:GNAT family N-acetyltransferase [Bowmanella yangjiangensis]MBT1062306.1 GNAT family N-acetyltransferase [Bowmanella yangjiangensis]
MQSLYTERLLLRPLTLEDAAALHRLNSDERVMRYIGPLQHSVEDTAYYLQTSPLRDYQRCGYGRHAVIHKGSGEFIGFCGLKYLTDMQETDIGYRLHPDYWGQGLALEAAQAAMQFGQHQLGLKRIIGLAMPDNQSSIRLLQKLGMRYEKQVAHLGTECVCYSVQY